MTTKGVYKNSLLIKENSPLDVEIASPGVGSYRIECVISIDGHTYTKTAFCQISDNGFVTSDLEGLSE